MAERSDDSRPTIYDVAHRAGVSKSLVSLVIRQSPGVSDRRRKAVLAVIKELGYQPSRAASTLAGSHSRSIGVLIDDYRNLWFVHLLDGIRHVMDQYGFHVTVSDQHSTGAMHQDAVDGFLSMHVEGIVVAAEPGNLSTRNIGVPVVVAGERDLRISGADVVTNDDVLGASLAVEHLVGLGHRRIGHLTGLGGSAARRRESYEAAMLRAGLEPMSFGAGGPTTEEGGFLACVDLLVAHRDVTAVFAANDTMALGALGALRQNDLSMPGDVSLVGYDNSPLASAQILDLTTIDDRSFDVGVEVATILLSRINDKIDSPPRRSLITPEIIVRSSTRELTEELESASEWRGAIDHGIESEAG